MDDGVTVNHELKSINTSTVDTAPASDSANYLSNLGRSQDLGTGRRGPLISNIGYFFLLATGGCKDCHYEAEAGHF